MFRAFKVELRLNNKQRTLCIGHAGAARHAYNWGLKVKQEAYRATGKSPGYNELNKMLNAKKSTEFRWMYKYSKCAPQEALADLDKAYKNFYRKTAKRPKVKRKGRSPLSFRLKKHIKVTSKTIRLPILGILRLKQHDYIPTSNIKILSATVSEKAGKWFVSVQVEMPQPQQQFKGPKDTHPRVGVDLGITTLATISDGQVFENPKAFRKLKRKLAHQQRSLSRKTKGSKNYQKAKHKVAQVHLDVSNIRNDRCHKVTSHLTKTKSTVIIEDLNVKGMLKNHKLAGATQDAGFYEFRRQLTYKGAWYGCEVVVAPRFFASSKLCSNCGLKNDELKLWQRSWTCGGCNTTHDRDLNAAKNLERFKVDPRLEVTQNACGGISSGSGGELVVSPERNLPRRARKKSG